jgi:peptidoglycan hydrolase CwlO-like protein
VPFIDELVTVALFSPAAAAPDPTTLAIHDLQTSQQQAVDQLNALQQTVSSGQAETRRLSEEVTGLARKLEALQQSFASAQRAPVVEPTEPAKQKRGGPITAHRSSSYAP